VLPSLAAPGCPTRLDLARWLVGGSNPLTARVTVNWVWHKYFGRGIISTLEDFGVQGERPSHPALLDYLATEFTRQGWGLKNLHRLIVCSATYRQSSGVHPELMLRDPNNILLARQSRRRLEAEILRDMALASSGLLARRIGGPSVRPAQPLGISELTYAGSARWVEDEGPDRHRRGLYIWFQRTSPYPMLLTFDTPDSNLSCVRRERSNSPLQALTLLNDIAFLECAQALGQRILDQAPADLSERIRLGFRLCITREPTAWELHRLENLYADIYTLYKDKSTEARQLVGRTERSPSDWREAAAWVALARVLLNLDEFVTRE
jgi:hypothetical protein